MIESIEAPVGTVLFEREDDGIFIRSIEVLPSYRGQGFSSKLLNVIENIALAEGLQAVYTSVQRSTPRLQEMVLDHGFELYLSFETTLVYRKKVHG